MNILGMPNRVNGKNVLTKANTKDEQPRISALLKVEQKWETLEGSIETTHFGMKSFVWHGKRLCVVKPPTSAYS